VLVFIFETFLFCTCPSSLVVGVDSFEEQAHIAARNLVKGADINV
jgi:hypothetical protein